RQLLRLAVAGPRRQLVGGFLERFRELLPGRGLGAGISGRTRRRIAAAAFRLFGRGAHRRGGVAHPLRQPLALDVFRHVTGRSRRLCSALGPLRTLSTSGTLSSLSAPRTLSTLSSQPFLQLLRAIGQPLLLAGKLAHRVAAGFTRRGLRELGRDLLLRTGEL